MKGAYDGVANTAFSAGEVLSLYGVIVTAIVTIIAVMLTIISTSKGQKVQRSYDMRYAYLSRNYQDKIDHLRKTISSISPFLFLKVSAPIYLSNYEEKKSALNVAKMDMVANVKMIGLYLTNKDYDEVVTEYTNDLANYSSGICDIIDSISTIYQKYTEYKIQQSENEKYATMQQMGSITAEQLEEQRRKIKEIGADDLNSICDELMVEYSKLVDLDKKECPQIISNSKMIFEHLYTKLIMELEEDN